MDSSQNEAEKKLRQKLALNALAKAEKIEVSESEVNSKLKEVESEIKLSKQKNIDTERLKEAINDDILQEKLFTWLEENNTVVEKDENKEGDSKDQKKEKSSKKKTTQPNKEKKSSKSPKS